ncbi:MAG: SPFH domain-containing protein [Bacteroidaceae bacterium]|nr:SPFH domain-containing protein [Paraprevotella sp.]MDY3099339.1 SPFH domain-containing protein [Bacteroidaceae bacterium]MDD6124897.1 SPFH domain-containing protein [Paraprevotella sp.]MDD6606294.1 SPFH domain-containing protein [Paraprevotella sp.]MDY3891889.1 SPFH domain-containing protein [Bacteroidaceae bacterium]
MEPFVFLIVLIVALVFLFVAIINRYRRCPSDKILVIYGNRGTSKSAKCVHGGGAFVWPIIEDYAYLSLTPIGIDANLTNALSKQNIRVDVPCRFTVGISTDPESMLAAAERLLGQSAQQIQELARDILFGQLRLVIATMSIEELNSDRDKFLEAITANVEVELKKIGLRLINVNVTDIKDESGYIEALGQEAAAKAINEAKVRVAEQEKIGEIGKAEAVRETRIRTAEANAQAVQGENEAKIAIANSDSARREREAEAQRKAVAAEKVAQAQALEEAYAAEQKAEDARANRERASQKANVIVAQEIEKQRLVIAAEAEAEQKRVNAKGEADAIFAKMEAEANGLYQVLTKQAEGYDRMIKAAGGDATKAYTLLLLEKLPELVKTQVDAIKGINIDKVTVWDNGGGAADGKTSTANFLSGLMKSIPPLNELFDQAGLSLPDYLAKKNSEDNEASPASTDTEA